MDSVEESGVSVQATDLLEFLLGQLKVEDVAILKEVSLLTHPREDDLLVVHVPVENDLS